MNVQMNVRIDEELKRAGDDVFYRMGLTPSEVVRIVWRFAAEHRQSPAIVQEALDTSFSEFKQGDALRQLAYIDEASSVCQRLREQFGLQAPDELIEHDYRALHEEAMRNRIAERGLA